MTRAESFFIHLPMKMERIEGSETSAFRTQAPGNYPKENILHKENGESLKSIYILYPSCVLKDRSGRDPILVAVLFRAWVCSCSLAGIAGSNCVEWHGCLSLVIIV